MKKYIIAFLVIASLSAAHFFAASNKQAFAASAKKRSSKVSLSSHNKHSTSSWMSKGVVHGTLTFEFHTANMGLQTPGVWTVSVVDPRGTVYPGPRINTNDPDQVFTISVSPRIYPLERYTIFYTNISISGDAMVNLKEICITSTINSCKKEFLYPSVCFQLGSAHDYMFHIPCNCPPPK